jgi:TonB family protein
MEGYVNGTLSPEMTRQLELFLKENPFEAEAVEGLKAHPANLSNEMVELETRLSKITKPEQTTSFQYWTIAAAVSLLIISGVLFYLFSPLKHEQTQLAIEQQSPNNEDSVHPIQDTETSEVIVEDLENKKQETEYKPPENAAKELPNIQAAEIQDKSSTSDSKQRIANLSNHNQPQESANPAGDVANSDEGSEIRSPRLQPVPNEESTGREITSSGRTDNSLRSLTPSAKTNSLQQQQALNGTLSMAEAPEIWNDYLKMQLRYPEAARTKKIEGKVKLTFQVNTNGSVFGIEIINSLGYGCDQEAIRILSEGPSWKPATIGGNPVVSHVEIEIRFPPAP